MKSEPFGPSYKPYRSLVYKFKKKTVGKTEFSDQFKKIIMRYKRIGFNVDVMRQSACLVVNPIMVNRVNRKEMFKN